MITSESPAIQTRSFFFGEKAGFRGGAGVAGFGFAVEARGVLVVVEVAGAAVAGGSPRSVSISSLPDLPTAAWTRDSSARPVIIYAMGTHGLGSSCAPSKQFDMNADYEAPNVAAALKAFHHIPAFAAVLAIGQDFLHQGDAHGSSLADQVAGVQAALLLGGFFPPPTTFAFVLTRVHWTGARLAADRDEAAFVQLVERHIALANVRPDFRRAPVGQRIGFEQNT